MKTTNENHKKKFRGISLMVLIITVIVMIILASAVILMVVNKDTIDIAKEAALRTDMRTMLDNYDQRYREVLYGYQGDESKIKNSDFDGVVPDSYLDTGDYVAEKDGVRYQGDDERTKEIAKEMGLLVGNDGMLTGIDSVSVSDTTTSTAKAEVNLTGNPKGDFNYTYYVYDGTRWIVVGDSVAEGIYTIKNLKYNWSYKLKVEVSDNYDNTFTSDEVAFTTEELLIGRVILRLNDKNGSDYVPGEWTNQNVYIEAVQTDQNTETSYVVSGANTISRKTQVGSVLALQGKSTATIITSDGANEVTSEAKILIDKENPTGSLELTSSTNSITARVMNPDDNLSGIKEFRYYIDNIIQSTQKEPIYTFSKDIIQNTNYEIKVVIVDVAGNESALKTSVTTETVPNAESILIEATPTTWTNGDVNIKVEYKGIEGYRVQYSKNGLDWETISQVGVSGEYTTTVAENTTVYVRYIDGIEQTGISKSLTIANIDKQPPTIDSLETEESSTSDLEMFLIGKAIDNLSGIVAYQFSTDDSLSVSSAGWISVGLTNSQITQKYTIHDNGTYYFYVKDLVGNVSKKEIVVDDLIKTYTVIYDGNGATGGTTASSIHTFNVPSALAQNGFTKTGYTFNGWNTLSNGTGISYTDGQVVNNIISEGSITLYAQWKPNEYTLTLRAPRYHANSTWKWDIGEKIYKVKYDSKVNLKDYTDVFTAPEGYHYAGTSTDDWWIVGSNDEQIDYTHNPGDGSESTFTIKGNMIAQLHYYPNDYVVKFFENKNYVSESGRVVAVLNGRNYTKVKNGGALAASFYDGTWSGPLLVSTTKEAVAYYSSHDPTTENNSSGSFVLEGVTYYYSSRAAWYQGNYKDASGLDAKQYTGSSLSDVAQKLLADNSSSFSDTYTYDVNKNLKSDIYTKKGYTLAGWSKNPTGDVEYANGTSVKNIATSGTVNLYAIWKANTYSLTFNASGGNVSTSSKTITYGSKYGDLPTPTREGYTFEGWYTGTNGTGTKITSSSTVTNTANHTLYAKWTINSYYIDLNTYLDGEKYEASRVKVNLIIGGSNIGYVSDYYTQHPYGTKWSIDGIQINGVNVPYTASGTLGASSEIIRLDFYTLTIARNNTSYGTVSASSMIVLSGKTYSTSGATLTINDGSGRNVTASPTAATGYSTTFSSWSPSSATMNTTRTVTANFSRRGNTYYVAYNGNGATGGSTATSTHTYGVSKALTSNGFVKNWPNGGGGTIRWSFKNWNRNAAGTSTSYSNGQSVINLATSGTVTLYAQWTFNNATGVMGGSNDVNMRTGPGSGYANIGGSTWPTYAVKGANCMITNAAYENYGSSGKLWLYVTCAARNLQVDTALGTKTGWVSGDFVRIN